MEQELTGIPLAPRSRPQRHWLDDLSRALFQFPLGPPDSMDPVVSSLFQLDDSLV